MEKSQTMLGLNINVLQSQYEAAIRSTRPSANFLLNPKGEESAKVKAAWPSALLIGRPHIPDGEAHSWYLHGDPADAGRRAALVCEYAAASNPAVDAWVLVNEPPVASVEQISKLALFDASFVRHLKAKGLRACIGAFARGTPEIPSEDGGAALRAYMPALRAAEEMGALVAFHQYGFNPLLSDGQWHALRWQTHLLPWLAQQGLSEFEYVITETGCDLSTGRMEGGTVKDGWRTAFGDTPEGRDAYASQLQVLVSEYAKDHRCKGVMLYCAGNQDRWGDFDVTGPMLDRLMAVQWPRPATQPTPIVTPPPTPTPKPEVTVTAIAKPPHEWLPSPNLTVPGARKVNSVIVFHHTGGALSPSLNWLRNPASGVSTTYLVAKTGKTYQLVSDDHVAWHAGYSRMPDGRENVNLFSLSIEIENDGDGRDPYPQVQIDAVVALAKYLVAKYAIPRSGNVTHELIRRLWKERYPNRLDDQGRTVSYKTDPKGLDMDKLLDRIYASVPAPAPIITIPPAATLLLSEANKRVAVSLNPSAAIQKVIFAQGFVPNSAEFTLTHDGVDWVCQRAERLSDGTVRVFYVKKGDWGNVKWVEQQRGAA
jgi:hypothetical protein